MRGSLRPSCDCTASGFCDVSAWSRTGSGSALSGEEYVLTVKSTGYPAASTRAATGSNGRCVTYTLLVHVNFFGSPLPSHKKIAATSSVKRACSVMSAVGTNG